MRIQTTKDITEPKVKLLVYGEAGTGKTVLCGTAPNPIILSAESGLLSLRGKDIPYIQVTTLKELTEAFEFLVKSEEVAQKYDTICVDSLSEIAELVLIDEKKKTKDGRKAYGEAQDSMIAFVRAIRDLPKHIYLSCKEGKIIDGITQGLIYRPALTGQKLSEKVPYFFDEVFRLYIHTDVQTGNKFRVLQTEGDEICVAKDRSGKLTKWEQPDLTSIITKITS